MGEGPRVEGIEGPRDRRLKGMKDNAEVKRHVRTKTNEKLKGVRVVRRLVKAILSRRNACKVPCLKG